MRKTKSISCVKQWAYIVHGSWRFILNLLKIFVNLTIYVSQKLSKVYKCICLRCNICSFVSQTVTFCAEYGTGVSEEGRKDWY